MHLDIRKLNHEQRKSYVRFVATMLAFATARHRGVSDADAERFAARHWRSHVANAIDFIACAQLDLQDAEAAPCN